MSGPQRVAARGACPGPGACRSKSSILPGPSLDLSGAATGRLDYALEGQPHRPPRPQGARLEPRRAGARVEADRRRRGRRRQRQPGRDPRGGGERRHRHRPGPGALRAARRRAAGRGAAQRAAVRPAALCRPGRYLVAAVGHRGARPVRPDRDRRRHRRPLADPRSAVRSAPTMRGSKARSPAWRSIIWRRQARFCGSAADLQPDLGQTSGGGSVAGTGSVTFSGGRPRSTCRSTPTRRCCSTATTSRRGSPARCSSSPTARRRHHLGQPPAQPRPVPARPGQRRGRRPAAPGPRSRARSRGRDRGRSSSTRGSST